MCVVKGIVRREPKTKQEVFWSDFVPYYIGTGPYLSSAAIDPWQIVLRLRGSLINRPVSELNDRLEDYLEAAYHLGEVAGFTEALRLLYELGLAKDYLELPKTSEKLQKLAFELYWLFLRIERTKLRRNERLAQKAANLNYGFYRLFEKSLKAACARK